MLKNMDQEIYEQELKKSGNAAVLCFLKNKVLNPKLVASLVKFSDEFASVQFYVVQEDALPYFFVNFQFLGTPTYIFWEGGTEKDRLLGAVKPEKLRSFIEKNIK